MEYCLSSYGKSILDDLSEKQVVIDGKKQCGTSPTSRGNCFCIAQKKVQDKSNEITAIPEILSDIGIEDAVVSIDAMGTQRETAGLIAQNKGHYLPAVKRTNVHCTRISNAPSE